MLYIIGIGLNDEKDISLKGIDALRNSDEVYCELYTNKWHGSLKALEELAGKNIIVLDREKTESDFIVERAKDSIVAFLVPGDPLSATTHFETFAGCKRLGIHVEAVHSSSIFTAVAETGLDLYKFGRTTTLPKDRDPESPYEMINHNKKEGLHTIVLLDIGMTAAEGLKKMANRGINETVMACLALGSPHQKILYDTPANIIDKDIKTVPCCIIVPGKLNDKEKEFLEIWKTSKTK